MWVAARVAVGGKSACALQEGLPAEKKIQVCRASGSRFTRSESIIVSRATH